MAENIAFSEMAKYRKMWAIPEYGNSAPGLRHIDAAIESLCMTPGATVYDYGSGSGKVAAELHKRGYDVVGIDIAENANTAFSGTVIICPIWEIRRLPIRSYGICTDVMEHIPTSKVADTINAIWRTSDKCYFQICTRPDTMGAKIGETLHMTVQPAEWWIDQLSRAYQSVEWTTAHNEVIAICAS